MMDKYYKIKALTNFFHEGNNGEKAFVHKGEIIEVDKIAKRQLVNEKMLCENIKNQTKTKRR